MVKLSRFSGKKCLTAREARDYAALWLPAWTGNNPAELAAYYSEDCFYEDAGIPGGAHGKRELLRYFRKLLAQNPDWTWEQLEAIPMEGGFLNKWRAQIPVGDETIVCVGVCFAQLDEDGRIRRNEVFFDRSELLAAIVGRTP